MGSFFKECAHPSSRWSKCPHEYTIRYRNASGRQTEESGFTTQELAKSRLAEVYHARLVGPEVDDAVTALSTSTSSEC
ncbi:hypothetical protein ACFC26_25220 [Kitasatospora purpeofusca]|uniref:hypothetical protein n=1 Tax=Kitasatospora purpeofusca TaxID=67352 RepID=UPI0035D8B2A7